MLGLKPIKTLPIREKIAANLREAILSKKIPAGEILTLESTAQELGVSITPTREAFQILARDGLLELERNKRAVVLGVNEKTIREHFQVRAALESEACVLCCENKIDLQRIDQILKVSREEIEKGDLKVIQVSIRLCTWNYGQQQEMINLKYAVRTVERTVIEAYW